MARPFNLTAQLNVQGPAGIRPVVQKLRRELSGIKADLKVDISPAAARNASKLNQQIKQLQGSLSSAASEASKLSASINSTVSSLNKLQGAGSKASTGMKNVASASSDMGKQLGVARTEMEEFGRVSGLALRRFAGFTVASTAVFGFVRAVTEGVGAAVSFERELVKIAQVTGASVKQLQGLSNEVTRISTTFGVASSDLIEVARTLNQAGLSADDTRKALEALGKSSLAPTFTDIRNTTEGAIASFRQFGISAGQLEQVLGSINAVAGNFAVEADDIISVIRRTGGVFKAASGDIGSPIQQLQELAAVFTSVRATTRESAESIATGLRTILTRIQRPRTIDFLRQFNIELQNSQGQFIGAFNAFQKLSEGLSDLDPRDVRFSQIVEEIGGFRQVGKLIPAIQQFTVAQEALNVAQQGTGSLTRDAATAQQALAIQVLKVRQEFEALIRSLTESETFKTVAGGALELASSLIKVAEAMKPVLPFLAIIGAVKGFGLARQFGSGFFGGIRAGGGAGGVGAGLAGAATGQRAAAEQATTQALTNALNGLLAVQKANTGALTGNTSALNRLSNSVRTAGIGRRGFASGGLVPGAGNRDTVPAMLTPGEFVIRKSSVQKYGASTLAGINNPIRRNKGSKLPENTLFDTKAQRTMAGASVAAGASKASQLIRVGAAFLQPIGIDRDIRGSVPTNEIVANTEKSLGGKAGFGSGTKKALKKQINTFATNQKVNFEIISGSLPAATAQQFETELSTAISDMALRFAQEEMGSLRSGFDRTKMSSSLRNFNFEQVSGNIFEAMVNASLNPFENIAKERANAPFDFPVGLGQVAKKFGEQRLSNIPTDTKRTFSAEAIANIVNKIKTIAFEFATGQLLGAGSKNAELAKLSTFTDKKTGVKGTKFFASGANPILRRAAGGRIPRKGTDSIPALLTPGEFVMSASASKSIGTGTLQALNKGTFRGYANGGLVQRFHRGSTGPVKPAPGQMMLPGLSTQVPVLERGLITLTGATNQATAAIARDASANTAHTATVVNDTRAETVNMSAEQRVMAEFMRALMFATGQLKGLGGSARFAGASMRGTGGGPGGPGGGLFLTGPDKKGGGKFKMDSGKAFAAMFGIQAIASMLPQGGTVGAVGQGVATGSNAALTASMLGLGGLASAGVGLVATVHGIATGLKEASIEAAAKQLNENMKRASETFKEFQTGGATSTELNKELDSLDRRARLNTLAQAGGIFTRRQNTVEDVLKTVGDRGGSAGTEGENVKQLVAVVQALQREFQFIRKDRSAAGALTGERRERFLSLISERDRLTPIVQQERFSRGARNVAIEESAALQEATRIRLEQLNAGIAAGQTVPSTERVLDRITTSRTTLNQQGELATVTTDIAKDITDAQAGFIGVAQNSVKFRQTELQLIENLRREFKDIAQTQSGAEATSSRKNALEKFAKARDEALIKEGNRISGAAIAQKTLDDATKLANKEINLLAEKLTTMSQVMKVVQGNFSESIRLERTRAKAFEGNFEVAVEKNPLSKVLENPRAFGQAQIEATLDSVGSAFSSAVGPGQARNAEKIAEGAEKTARILGGVESKLSIQRRGLVEGRPRFIDAGTLATGAFGGVSRAQFDNARATEIERTVVGGPSSRGPGMADLFGIRTAEGGVFSPAARIGRLRMARSRQMASQRGFQTAQPIMSKTTRFVPSPQQQVAPLVGQLDSSIANVRGQRLGAVDTAREQRALLGSNITQLLRGASEFASVQRELPGVVAAEIAKTGPAAGTPVETRIADAIRAGREDIISPELAKSLGAALGAEQRKRQAEGGAGGILEAGEITKIINPIFENQLKVSTEITKILEGGVKEFVKATNDRINLEKKVIALNLKQQQKQAKVDNLRGTMRTGGFDTAGRAAIDFENQIAALTIGTGVGVQTRGQFGTAGTDIGARLTEIARERKALEATVATDALSDPESAKRASDALVKLGVESNNLVTAVGLLADSSADLAAIEAEKAKIESSAQGFQGILRQVLTGNTEGAMGILRGAALSAEGVQLGEGNVQQNQDLFAFSDALGTVGNDSKTIVNSGMFAEIRATAQAVAGLSGRDATSISGLLLSTGDREGAFSGLQERLAAINSTIDSALTTQEGLLAAQDESLRNIAGSVQQNLITPLQNAIDSIDKTGKIGTGQNLRNLPTLPQQGVPQLPPVLNDALQKIGNVLGGGGGAGGLAEGLGNLPDFTGKVGEAATTINKALGSFEEAVESFTAKDFTLKISPDSAIQLVGEGAFGQAVAEVLVPTVTRIVNSRISQSSRGPGATGEESTGAIGGAGGFRGF